MRRLRVLFALAGSCSPGMAAPDRDPGELRVTREDFAERIVLTGELAAERSDRMLVPMTSSFDLSVRWMVEEGTSVKAGDRIVEFDNSKFVSELAQKDLRLTQAALDLATERTSADRAIGDKEFALAREKVL